VVEELSLPIMYNAQVMSTPSPLSTQPVVINDMLIWINSAKLFNDILPRQWYHKWR
jgi:hypothetical protein